MAEWRPHSARANGSEDFVRAEFCANRVRHRGGLLNLPLRILVLLVLVALSSGLLAFQRGGYIEMDGESFPPDGTEKVEWIFSRFHYSASDQFGYFGGFHRWAADYPKSDRQFLVGVRRLTRIDTRPTGQVLDADSRELLNYPWLYVERAAGLAYRIGINYIIYGMTH